MTHEEILEKLEKGTSRYMPTWVGEVDGFEIVVETKIDELGYQEQDFGAFCEKERAPKWAKFFVRNEAAWYKADLGNGTDSWVRYRIRDQSGWFALADHPADEARHYMNDGLTEREAWAKTLARIRRYVKGLADDSISWVGVIATASRNGIELGTSSCWGVEIDDRDPYAERWSHVEEVATDQVAEAIEDAKKALKRLCECH